IAYPAVRANDSRVRISFDQLAPYAIPTQIAASNRAEICNIRSWVGEITARIGRVTRLPCFLQLLNPDTVGVGDDVDPVPPVTLDAVQGIVGHLAQVFGTQWVFG